MTEDGRRQGSALLAAVLVALAVGAVGLAAVSRSSSASAEDELAGCAAAGSLEPSATVAIVDSGIERSALPSDSVIRDRIDLTDDTGEVSPHGTEIASIVAAQAPSARLLDIRVLDGDGSGSTRDVARGIEAALASGADVINLSSAVPASDPAIRAAMRAAVDAGSVVVVAAGNDARDLGRDPAWRAIAADPCTVVVGAAREDGTPLATSNHGSGVVEAWVDGDAVPAVGLDGQLVAISGTSPAAAAVTGELIAG